ncbi:NUDIX domain-containing protein [Patescibacteria group bacterium]|nr:NUDIX domain-containing protein [Patescibacteria group bacterium]
MVKKLPADIFLKTFKYIPRIALNLIITNNKGEILLAKRAKPPLVNFWHFPGSFLLKGEKLNICLTRIAKDELGLNIDSKKTKLLGIFEDLKGDSRGHVIDVMYGIKITAINPLLTKDSKEIAFFKNLPDKIGFNHKETLLQLGFK